MGKKIYISFDAYYDIDMYNSFKTAARNNKVEFEEFLKVRPPFNRFLYIDDSELPGFLNYDVASASDIKFLVSTVKAVQPNEEYLLRRREGRDISYWNYILPKPLVGFQNKPYIMIFKAWDMSELNQWSKELGKTKIYKWGKAEIKSFKIYFCFNPYIKGLIPSTRILMEFGEGTSNPMPSAPGDLEYLLNYKVLVKEKLMNKTFELEYHQDGKKFPLKRTTFIN